MVCCIAKFSDFGICGVYFGDKSHVLVLVVVINSGSAENACSLADFGQ